MSMWDRVEFFAVNRSITELKGLFDVAKRVVSIDEMNQRCWVRSENNVRFKASKRYGSTLIT